MPWALAVLLWALSGRGLGSRAGALPLLWGPGLVSVGRLPPPYWRRKACSVGLCKVSQTQNRARRHFACRNSTHFCPAGPSPLQPISATYFGKLSPCARPAQGAVWIFGAVPILVTVSACDCSTPCRGAHVRTCLLHVFSHLHNALPTSVRLRSPRLKTAHPNEGTS